MAWIAAAVSIGSSLIGQNKQKKAAERAADITARDTKDAIARQKPFYDASVNELPNYLKGIQPGGDLVRGFTGNDFQQYQDPGYGFRLNEGLKALQGSAAARGGLLSGNTLRGISDYSQQAASQEYGNAYNRFIGEQTTRRNALAGLVGQGPTGANTINAASAGQAENRANASLYGANAQAQAVRNIGSVASDYFRQSSFSPNSSGAGSNRMGDYSGNMQLYGM